MPILTAAVVLVGALGLLNLILAAAIIRRLREVTARLSGAPDDDVLLPVGSEVGPLLPAGAAPVPVQEGTKIVALMSTTCTACLAALDATAARARDLPGGPADILVAVQGEGGHLHEIAAALGDVTTLVTGPAADDLVRALQGRAFPSFYLLEDGRIRAAGHSPAALPSVAGASAGLV